MRTAVGLVIAVDGIPGDVAPDAEGANAPGGELNGGGAEIDTGGAKVGAAMPAGVTTPGGGAAAPGAELTIATEELETELVIALVLVIAVDAMARDAAPDGEGTEVTTGDAIEVDAEGVVDATDAQVGANEPEGIAEYMVFEIRRPPLWGCHGCETETIYL